MAHSLPPFCVEGDCSASRPNSNPFGGVVADVLIEGCKRGGSINLRNMTYEMNENCLKETQTSNQKSCPVRREVTRVKRAR